MKEEQKSKGRPLAGEDRRSVTVRLRMEPGEAERLDRMAGRLETTRSGAIRAGLRLLEDQIGQKQE